MGKTFAPVNLRNGRARHSPMATEILRANINQGDLVQLTSFCTARGASSKTQRQLPQWETSVSNGATHNGFISRTYTPHIQLGSGKADHPMDTCAKDLKTHFSKEDMQMANKHMKQCSTSLVIREMQIKTTVRCHLTPITMAILRQSPNNKGCRGCAEKGTLLPCWWEWKLVQPLCRTLWRYLRNRYVELPYDPAIPRSRLYPDSTLLEKDTCTRMFITARFTMAKPWKPPKCPSTDDWIAKMCYIYTVASYSAIPKNTSDLKPLAAPWMELEALILREIRQKENNEDPTASHVTAIK